MAEELVRAVLLPHESLCCLFALLAVAFGRLSYFGSSNAWRDNMDDGSGGISDKLNSAVRYWGLIPNISEVLGIEDQKGEALWMAFICK